MNLRIFFPARRLLISGYKILHRLLIENCGLLWIAERFPGFGSSLIDFEAEAVGPGRCAKVGRCDALCFIEPIQGRFGPLTVKIKTREFHQLGGLGMVESSMALRCAAIVSGMRPSCL